MWRRPVQNPGTHRTYRGTFLGIRPLHQELGIRLLQSLLEDLTRPPAIRFEEDRPTVARPKIRIVLAVANGKLFRRGEACPLLF